jgi:hypothetical protein
MVSVAGSTRSSVLRVRRGAPDGVEVTRQAWDPWSAGVPLSGVPRPWTRAGSHRFPGDPSHAFALLQDPGRADTTSPFAVLPILPPDYPNRRPQRVHNLEANTVASATAVYASRALLPAPMQDSLPADGLRLYREGVEPSGSLRKVSGYIPFSFPGLLLSQGWSTPSPRLAAPRPCWPISAATPTAWPSRTTA